jgi:hypothetical protein
MNEVVTLEELALSELVLNLLLGVVLSTTVAWYYARFGEALSNRAKFVKLLPVLCLITVLVISVIKASLALSLGRPLRPRGAQADLAHRDSGLRRHDDVVRLGDATVDAVRRPHPGGHPLLRHRAHDVGLRQRQHTRRRARRRDGATRRGGRHRHHSRSGDGGMRESSESLRRRRL